MGLRIMCSDELEAASPAKFLTVTKGLVLQQPQQHKERAVCSSCLFGFVTGVCEQPNGFFNNAQVIPNV